MTSLKSSAGEDPRGGAPSNSTTTSAATLPNLSPKSQLFRVEDRLTSVPVAEQSRTIHVSWGNLQRFGLFVALAVMVAFFIYLEPDAFLSPINMRSLAETAAPILIVSVATTFVLASGGIDLSIGSVLVLSGVMAQRFFEANGGREAEGSVVFIGIGIALATGLVCGLINGLLITVLQLPPLIATLGMMGAALGAAQLITDGQDLTAVPTALVGLVKERPLGIPLAVYIAVIIAVIGAVILRQTRFGLRVLGIGSDETVLKRRGIGVDAHKVRVYALAGLAYAVAGVIGLGQYSTTAINGHTNDAIVAITAVVIGGTSLFGGSATMFGTVIGVLIPTVLDDGLVITGIPAYWQNVVTGIVLVVAVFFDQLQRRRRGT